MPTMRVFRGRRKVRSETFQNLFTVLREIEGERALFWVADRKPELGEGTFLIRISGGDKEGFEIASVGTDWQLSLDSVRMDPGSYTGVDVSGRTMELAHEDYRFVCSFTPAEGKDGSGLEDAPPYREFFPLLESGPATMHAYQGGKEVETRDFWGQFCILLTGEGELHWLADNDQAPPGGGQTCIWIIGGGTAEREIKSVGPDWLLTIDGVAMDRGIYLDVYVSGKTVELERDNYRFVFSFASFEGERVLRSEDEPPYIFAPVSRR